MFITQPIVASGNAAIAACNAANEAEARTLELRVAAVAAIQQFNEQLGFFLDLHGKAIVALEANGGASRGMAEAHRGDLLPAAIPDPDQSPGVEPPLVLPAIAQLEGEKLDAGENI